MEKRTSTNGLVKLGQAASGLRHSSDWVYGVDGAVSTILSTTSHLGDSTPYVLVKVDDDGRIGYISGKDFTW